MHVTRSLGASRQRQASCQSCRCHFRLSIRSKSNSRPEGAARLFHQPNEKARLAGEPRQHNSSEFSEITGDPPDSTSRPSFRPLSRRKNPTRGQQWIVCTISQVALPPKAEPMQNAAFQVMGRRFAVQLVLQYLMENLQRARSVNEGCSRIRHDGRANGDGSRSPDWVSWREKTGSRPQLKSSSCRIVTRDLSG